MMVCIVEPKLTSDRVESVKHRLKFDQACVNQENNAKIWLFWNNHSAVSMVQRHPQYLTVQCLYVGGGEFFITFVYASCSMAERRDLYEELSQFGNTVNHPWMLGGDFNAILSPEEKKGGTMGFISSMTDFQGFTARNGLLDAGFTGSPYTWSNNQVGVRNIKARLDRVLYNDCWAEKERAITVKHLMREPSDHSPLLLYHPQMIGGPSRFVFQHMWMEDKNFLSIVKKAWTEATCTITTHPTSCSTNSNRLKLC